MVDEILCDCGSVEPFGLARARPAGSGPDGRRLLLSDAVIADVRFQGMANPSPVRAGSQEENGIPCDLQQNQVATGQVIRSDAIVHDGFSIAQ